MIADLADLPLSGAVIEGDAGPNMLNININNPIGNHSPANSEADLQEEIDRINQEILDAQPGTSAGVESGSPESSEFFISCPSTPKVS